MRPASVSGFWGRFLALFISILMVVQGSSLFTNTASAVFDTNNYKVDSVTIFKVYDANRNLQERRVLIQGTNIADAKVGIVTSSGYQDLSISSRTVNSASVLQFDLAQDQLGNAINIGNFSIPVDEGQMPVINGVSSRINMGTDDLTIEGSNLTKVTGSSITAWYEHEGASTQMPSANFTDDYKVTIPTPQGSLGYQNIIFDKTNLIQHQTFNTTYSDLDINVHVKYTYIDQFRFVQKITVPGLEVYPNRGESGDTVYFQGPSSNLKDYDVFFLKKIDGTDPYTASNMGTNHTYNTDTSTGKSIISVQVPKLPVGDYYMVLTNRVTTGNDPMKEVVQELVVGEPDYIKFTIVDANIKSKIIDISPNTGPDTGSEAQISGLFFSSMNIPEFKTTDTSITVEDPNTDIDPTELLINYGAGTYNGVPVDTVQRKVKVIIGANATFLKNTSGAAYNIVCDKNLDKLYVQVPQITDAETNPKKDVVVQTETTFHKTSGGSIVILERAEKKGAYTFIPSKVTPSVTDALPDKIQVEPDSSGGYKVSADTLIGIHGTNFMITKFKKSDGTEVVRYPIIRIGSTGFNKNLNVNPGDPASTPLLDLKIFDSTGKELDGSDGSEIGTKMLLLIPAGTKVSSLGKVDLTISNPVRNSESTGIDTIRKYFIEYVYPDKTENPSITLVNPSTATVDGGDTITITGSNFIDGARVFLDGEEVKEISRQGDGKKITFVCPKGRECETLLEVMNPKGGMDSWPFSFVKSYTNPKISDFTPKLGNTGTMVVITGQNFLKPDPTATETGINKLIGTRVLMENTDINDYNLNPATKKVELRDYTAPAAAGNLVSIATGASGNYLKAADYYSGVLLETPLGRFYMLDVNAKGDITITDGISNTYTLSTDGSVVKAANLSESSVVVGVYNDELIINDSTPLVLKMRTLYKVDSDGIITGNRVKVVDMNHIYFRVPPLPADGYYDITVLNPDTKKDSKIGDKGFYYYGQPQSRPQVNKIYPSEGSVDGGYSVTISGKDFEDNGTTKAKVYLNGMEADPKNVNVSIDGSTITFIVPAYPGDLMRDLGTNQINVPLVIVNPDGASCSIENGFMYVIPGSHPKITNIVPAKGAASGGDIVEITGSDFRFFEPFTDKNKNLVRDSDEVFTDVNGNGLWDSEPDKTTAPLPDNVTYSTYYTSPILPSLFFGSQKAQIVEYSRGYLKVIAPSGLAGTVNVYLVNNDAGTSNKITFTYESSNPSITKITPSQGKKQGGDNVEIAGTGFRKNTIYVYNASTDSNGNNLADKVTMPLVNFGGITNRNKLREEANSGRIDNEKTTVNLDGNLSIEYDASAAALKLTLANNKTYEYTINGYDGSVKFVPLSLLKDGTGSSWNGFELVRFEVSNKRLFVDRGYSTAVQYLSATLISVSTPTYYTVGNVPVRIENPDKGQATGTFIYKNPSSAPVIRSITKEDQQPSDTTVNGKAAKVIRVSINGGSVLNITGDDFRDNARVQISDILEITPDKITYSLPNHITFQMPSVPDSVLGKFYRVMVLNEDGGSAASDGMSTPIYISFTKGETKPSVKNLSPSSGPAVGGTRVKLEGSDFRQTMEGFDSKLMVYFGDTRIPDSDITVTDYKTIYVTAPAHYAGKVKVRVQNPDGEVSPEDAGYTYVSCPKIIAAVDGSSSGDNVRISTISIKGGQVIKIKGSGFLSGATVMFNPTEVLYDGSTQGQTIYTVNKTYILTGGTAGTNVNVLDLETLTVTVPAGKLGTSGIIVINPDGGASDIYGDITYGLPEVSVPANVKATLSYSRYIKISWSAVAGAKSYEVYASLDGGSYGFIGSTALTEFLYKDLKPGVTYKFTVKALGDYGPSNASAESNSVTTGGTVGPPDTDGGLTENTVIQKSGSSASVVIGRNSLKSSSYVIDLTTGELAGCKDVTVSIPASVINGLSNNDIIINGEDIKIKLSPYAFKTTLITQNSSRSDAGVRLSVSKYNGSNDIHQAEGTPLSNQYIMEVNTFVGKDSTSMKYLNSQIELTMDYDSQKADMRRIQNLGVSRYENGSWLQLSGGITTLNSIVVPVDRPGRYLVVGRR